MQGALARGHRDVSDRLLANARRKPTNSMRLEHDLFEFGRFNLFVLRVLVKDDVFIGVHWNLVKNAESTFLRHCLQRPR